MCIAAFCWFFLCSGHRVPGASTLSLPLFAGHFCSHVYHLDCSSVWRSHYIWHVDRIWHTHRLWQAHRLWRAHRLCCAHLIWPAHRLQLVYTSQSLRSLSAVVNLVRHITAVSRWFSHFPLGFLTGSLVFSFSHLFLVF